MYLEMISQFFYNSFAGIAQLGERQTEDLKVPGSIPGHGIFSFSYRLMDKLKSKENKSNEIFISSQSIPVS